MNKNLIYSISVPYFVIAIAVIFSRIFKIPDLENAFRPMLLILLIWWYVKGSSLNRSKISSVFIFALLFSLISDILRMPLFNNFIFGLVFFILAHVLYSSLFLWESKGRIFNSLLQGWLFVFIFFLILTSLLLGLLPPIIRNNYQVQLVALPTLVFALLLLVLSTYVYSQVFINNFGRFVLLGGLFFVFSDSLLAINRFSIEVKLSSVWILGSYVIAQWMLVYGYMNSKKGISDF